MRINRTKNAIRNMMWGYIYKIVGIIMPFAFRTVMIYVLGAEYLGINSLFTSILQVLSLSELGFGAAMVYSMYRPIAENDIKEISALLKFYKKIYTIIGSVILCVGTLLMPFITYLIKGDYPSDINIHFVYLMFLINTSISYFLFAYRGALLHAYQRNDVESKILTVVSVVRYLTEILGIYITKQYYLFLIIELFSTALSNVLKYITTKNMYPEIEPIGKLRIEKRKEIQSNVAALMFHKLGGIILNSADNIVLSAFMGVVIVAQYSNYYYIMNAISSIIMICFSGITAGIGNSFLTESVEKNRDYFKKILFFNAWLVGWCTVCLVCLYQDFMIIWVGERYLFTFDLVLLFSLYFYVHCIRKTIIVFRDGAGMWKDNKWQPIVSATFNLIINIILVQIIGVYGILLSSIMSMLIIDIPWESVKFCRRIDMRKTDYFKLLALYIATTFISCLCTYLLCSLIRQRLMLQLILKGVICILAPNILFCCFYHKSEEYTYFKKLVLRVFRKIDMKKI